MKSGCGALLAVVVVGVVGFLAYSVTLHGTEQVVGITVQRSERVCDSDTQSCRYLVWTTRDDGRSEVMEDVDEVVYGKYDSSDVYGQLRSGHHYRVKVAGWRMPVFSTYRNIIEVEGAA